MRLSPLPAEFEAAAPVLRRLNDAGYEAYFVGGAVRDALLHDRIHDVDIATSAYPAEVKALFKRTVDTGIQHGTVTVLQPQGQYEVTTFRTESTYQDYRRPDHVTFVRSLREDLQRRDFTVNALAMDHTGQITDLFDGLGDLQRHLLRAVGKPEERFHEDALRMMRAVRFQSQLSFTIEPATEAAIRHHHQLLEKIAVERINMEFVKMMAAQDRASGLKTFIDTQLYVACPGLAGQQTALTSMLADVPHRLAESGSVWLRLVFALGLAENAVGPFLRAWKTTNTERRQAARLLPVLAKIQAGTAGAWDLYQAGLEFDSVLLPVAAQLGIAVDQWQERYAALPIHQAHDLAVDGRTVMQAAPALRGPALGQAMTAMTQAVVAGQAANTPAALLAYIQKTQQTKDGQSL